MKTRVDEAGSAGIVTTAELNQIVEDAAGKYNLKVTHGGVEGTYFVADEATEVMVFVITKKDEQSANLWKIETDIQSILANKKTERYQRATSFTDELHTTLAGRRIAR